MRFSNVSRPAIAKLVVGVIALAAVGIFIARSHDVRTLLQDGLALVRGAGPVAFFLCMTLLPAIGVPLSVFTLTAIPSFGGVLGAVPVTLLAFASIALNLAFSYFLATRALRPFLQLLFDRLGYRMPTVAPAGSADLVLLLRVTPGLPFPVQNYLLGMAGVPFGIYMAVSVAVTLPMAGAFLFLGDALLKGRGRLALLGVMLLLAALAVTQILRRRLRARQSAAQAPGS